MISRRTSFGIRSESAPKTDRLNQVPSWEFRNRRKSFTPRQLARILWDFAYLCWANPKPTRRRRQRAGGPQEEAAKGRRTPRSPRGFRGWSRGGASLKKMQLYDRVTSAKNTPHNRDYVACSAFPTYGILRITAVHGKFFSFAIWLVKILIRSSKLTFERSWR